MEENDMLVTIDVSVLYTNIPHEEGLTAIHEWMITNHVEVTKANIIRDLARMVLTKNYFKFNNKIYLQVQETAVGTRMAPNYAIIFIHMLETSLLNNYHLQPKLWKRFIDDVFIIWQHGPEELERFLQYLNQAHPTIKFTSESSYQAIPFLDCWVHRKDNKLCTKVYHKAIDNK